MDTDCSRGAKMELRAEHWMSIIPYFNFFHTIPHCIKCTSVNSVLVVSQGSVEEVDANVKRNRPGRIAMVLTIQ